MEALLDHLLGLSPSIHHFFSDFRWSSVTFVTFDFVVSVVNFVMRDRM